MFDSTKDIFLSQLWSLYKTVLEFYPVERFGRMDYAPANSPAQLLTMWLGQKSLSKLNVKALMDIGFKIQMLALVESAK